MPKTKPTAVIVDDDAMSRQLTRAIFDKAGYQVLAGVGTALEALDVVLTHQPDVVLLDLVMPGMSGEEILPSLKAGSPDTKIVVFSAYDPTLAVKSGAMFIVPKGQHAKLQETIERLAKAKTHSKTG